MTSNERKTKQLGISYGTACGRLRKQIMFMLSQECNRDTCYRCGEKINHVEEFSIEHKQGWEGVSSDLFWDLNNIAFSHLACNKPQIYFGKKRVVTPEGTSWCVACKSIKDVKLFHKCSSKSSGYQSKCMECRKKHRQKK